MSRQNREPQDQGDHEMVDWEVGANDLDEEFRQGGTVELPSDDDEPPPDSDDEANPNEEIGVIDEKDIYSDDEMDPEGGVDNALTSVSHKDPVLSIALSPTDPRTMVTGGQDDVAVLWQMEDAWGGGVKVTQRCRLEGHTDSVVEVAFSHDGKYLATGGYDGVVKIWEAATGGLLHTLEGPAKEIEWIIWHPKGHAILAGSSDTMAWMWWAPTGKLMQIFAGHASSVTCGAWGLGGKVICTGSEDKSVIVWNPRQGSPQQHVKQAHESSILCMCSHPDAPIIVTGSEDSTANVIHIETGKVIKSLGGHTQSVECVSFNNAVAGQAGSMSLLATAGMDGQAIIWDAKTFELRCTLKDHCERGGVVKFKWLPASHSALLCTCSNDRTLRLFNGLSGECLHTLRGHKDTVLDLDIALIGSPQQLCVVSSSDDRTARVFAIPLGGGPATAAGSGGYLNATDAATAAVAPAAAGAPAALAPG